MATSGGVPFGHYWGFVHGQGHANRFREPSSGAGALATLLTAALRFALALSSVAGRQPGQVLATLTPRFELS